MKEACFASDNQHTLGWIATAVSAGDNYATCAMEGGKRWSSHGVKSCGRCSAGEEK